MATKYDCPVCKKQVTGTKNDRYRSHSDGDGEPCEMSSVEIPEHILANPVGKDDAPDVPREGIDFATCPQCDRRVKLTRLGYFEPHDTTLMGGDRCPVSGVRAMHARRTDDVPLPGDEPKGPGAAIPKVKAQEEITSAARTSGSAGAASSPTEPPPSSGTGDAAIDWGKVGDLKHLGAPADNPASTGPSGTTPTAERRLASFPDGTLEIDGVIDDEKMEIVQHSPESTSTSTGSTGPAPSPSPEPSSEETSSDGPEESRPFHLAPLLGDGSVLQPFSHISQPFPVPPRVKLAEAMSDRGKEMAARLREIFYAYTNRDHSSNRSAQKTLGPSEIGSPCDRQIAMKLLGIKPVNPQEGWAPFVGTAVHVELAKMFEWANGGGSGSGRYITEMRVQLPSALVPSGTLDVYDGVLYMVDDHKLMGRYSLDKLIQNGPSETYLTQLQVYGLGAVLAGFRVREVALIAWPRQESSLDKLYVHVEPFDRKVAEAAIKRVEDINEQVQGRYPAMAPPEVKPEMEVARSFPVGDDCKWCPFHLKGDKEMKRGCPGK